MILISRNAREHFHLHDASYTPEGALVVTDYQDAHRIAQRINQARGADAAPARASDIFALSLLGEVMHHLIRRYRGQVDPDLFQRALAVLRTHLGEDALETTLLAYVNHFPPPAVQQGDMTPEQWLAGWSHGLSHREAVLEYLILLWIANQNPAASPYRDLFDDAPLAQSTAYLPALQALRGFFDQQPGFAATGQSLIDLLLEPIRAAPDSLEGQLRYIRDHWRAWLGDLALKILLGLDFIVEETRDRTFGPPGPTPPPDLSWLEEEPENYTPDTDWMPRVVLLAKNTYVWLWQLARQYGRPITRLDEIPDEELDALAQRGITGLWLIGLWQRSRASQRIKQMMGNPEAVASAYAIDEYIIAEDFGGEEALNNLRERAWQRGIRLASDMAPNHMAIDSRWVIEHPDRFLALPYSPFPSYTFNGPDLCDDPRIGIFLEDGYYDRSDAAVVFKRVDYQTGEVRYIYHGNDGTSTPWNDTAQLDYLNPETREAVIQTILHIARQFPIIRFDAAMTLVKRHIQRLWWPEPGQGGAIPSRAAFAMPRDEFNRRMPKEFWREVVDRVAQEVPDTLLLAEAFWLMEGYFVRTLGMHRVYNSAFMHMMRDEENAKYRGQIKETLAFDPEILKRYVNFMTNPDEEPAAVQFGKGDKYFGVFTVMATVPGLPMIGHGQFEGFEEKYGMEYHRAYRDEQPDPALLARHQREIVPLLKRRALFADVVNFRLYDFETDAGVNEDVLAYSNRMGDQRALILYHNRFAETRGRVRMSVPFKGSDKTLRQETLAQGLALPDDPEAFVIFRELVSGLEYIHNAAKLAREGFHAELHAYQRLVFLDWRIVYDSEGRYARLTAELDGRGVPDIEAYLRRQTLRPLHDAFRNLITPDLLGQILAQRSDRTPLAPAQERAWDEAYLLRLTTFFETAQAFIQPEGDDDLDEDILLRRIEALETGSESELRLASEAPPRPSVPPQPRDLAFQTLVELRAALRLPHIARHFPWPRSRKYRDAVKYLLAGLESSDESIWLSLISYALLHRLGELPPADDPAAQARARYRAWMLDEELAAALEAAGLDGFTAARVSAFVHVLLGWQAWHRDPDLMARPYSARPRRLLKRLLSDDQARRFLGVNRHQGVAWYHKESMETLLHGLFAIAVLELVTEPEDDRSVARSVVQCYDVIRLITIAHGFAGYRVDKLLELT